MAELPLERAFADLLRALDLDPGTAEFRDTPRAAAKAWTEELCLGLRSAPPHLRLLPWNEGKTPQLVGLGDIPFKSICPHHLLPIQGRACVAYVARDRLCALSDLVRLVDHCARRPILQETLTEKIVEQLDAQLTPRGAAVQLEAEHGCLTVRGTNTEALMTTYTARGCLDEAHWQRAFTRLRHSP